MSTITATDGDDVLTGTRGADTIDGGAGDDIINSGAGDDVISGGAGDDTLNAGSGNDILEGGAGDDTLNGGGGSDVFVFNFQVAASGTTTVTFEGFDAGGDGKLSQNEFVTQYEAFLTENDVDTANFDQNSATDALAGNPDDVTPITISTGGTTTQTRYYEDTLYIESGDALEITASDGNDTITAFQDAGPNVDAILFNGLAGLTDAQLDLLFDIETIDTDGDGTADASLLTWDGGSIAIGGTVEWGDDVLAFFHDDQVSLL